MPQKRRRKLMMDLLRNGPVVTQEELVEALADGGEPVTQATVSRDLAALGAIRGPEGYRLGGALDEQISVHNRRDALMEVIGEHVVEAIVASSLVVLKTAPGHAQMVASAFDHSPLSGVVGTVAGDDTIFLATTAPRVAQLVARQLSDAIRGWAPGGSGA